MATTKRKPAPKAKPKFEDSQRRRQRVQISVDREVWARCQELSKLVGPELSWSQVAEFSFRLLLDQLEEMKLEVYAKLRPDATLDEAGSMMRDYFNRKIHTLTGEVYAQIEQDIEEGKATTQRAHTQARS